MPNLASTRLFTKKLVGHETAKNWSFGWFDGHILHSFSSPICWDMSENSSKIALFRKNVFFRKNMLLQKKEIGYEMDEKWMFGGFDRSILHGFLNPFDLDLSRGLRYPKSARNWPEKPTKIHQNYKKI